MTESYYDVNRSNISTKPPFTIGQVINNKINNSSSSLSQLSIFFLSSSSSKACRSSSPFLICV